MLVGLANYTSNILRIKLQSAKDIAGIAKLVFLNWKSVAYTFVYLYAFKICY